MVWRLENFSEESSARNSWRVVEAGVMISAISEREDQASWALEAGVSLWCFFERELRVGRVY